MPLHIFGKLILLVFLLYSCSDNEPVVPAAVKKQIIVMYSPGGLGDNGYNDCILRGMQTFRMKHYEEADIYQYSPQGLDEARRLLTDWLSLPASEVPALFVVASSDYEGLVNELVAAHPLTSNKRMLMFESHLSGLPVTTFQISMYGASFLAGVTAAEESGNALIVLAYEGEQVTKTAADGFRDGYAYAAGSGRIDTEYLATDWTGFVSAPQAFRNMERWSEAYQFIFPVAGGSNSGIYRYAREHDASPLLAGMDVDQSPLSNHITGSVVKHIDLLIGEYLTQWFNTGTLPASRIYGLQSGYTDWQLAPQYKNRFQSSVEAARQTAVEAENAYYGQNL
ncbi:MAG: BMP family ABC transporter substrate-binding protein [Alloprevotella sp.]|nr:BMP family ABC transporter substrate-binding protein [Alloprevotella sp.]